MTALLALGFVVGCTVLFTVLLDITDEDGLTNWLRNRKKR